MATQAPTERQRNVLVVSTVDHAEEVLRSRLGATDNVMVVVPVVSQGVLDWLANDERAFSRAQHVADETAAELPGETVEAHAGEADVDLAIRDALATFPADEIVIAVHPPDEQGVVEAGATGHLPELSFDGIPVRRVAMHDDGRHGNAGPVIGGSDSDDAEPATRSAKTPVLALGGTVAVIAIVFIIAVSLAALAYLLGG